MRRLLITATEAQFSKQINALCFTLTWQGCQCFSGPTQTYPERQGTVHGGADMNIRNTAFGHKHDGSAKTAVTRPHLARHA